jgi:hypothetical protein
MTAESHTEAIDTWTGEPGVELASNLNRGTTGQRRGFRPPAPVKDTMSPLRRDWRTDRIGTEARLRAISDRLLAFAAASRARLADLDGRIEPAMPLQHDRRHGHALNE